MMLSNCCKKPEPIIVKIPARLPEKLLGTALPCMQEEANVYADLAKQLTECKLSNDELLNRIKSLQ